jgi:lysophospholipase L1-like esterase
MGKVLAINLAVLVALGLVAEVGLRLAGVRTEAHDVRYENDPLVGPWAMPSQHATVQGPCYRSHVSFNSLGMRDIERDPKVKKAPKRVALVGDSMVQGAQVDDDENISRVLEKGLAGKAEVLNFGISSVGTAVELLTYRKRVRPFQPDVVVLMLMSGNDIADNLPELKVRVDPAMAPMSPYILLDEKGNLREDIIPGRAYRTSRLRGLVQSTALGQWLYKFYVKVRFRAAARQHAAINDPTKPLTRSAAEEALWDRAWRTTLALVKRFRDEVEKDKARFVLVHVPADNVVLGQSGQLVPLAATASERLTRLAEEEKIPFLDLAKYYQDAVKKDGPFDFALPCDGHWNVRGHKESAEQVKAFLEARGLL